MPVVLVGKASCVSAEALPRSPESKGRLGVGTRSISAWLGLSGRPCRPAAPLAAAPCRCHGNTPAAVDDPLRQVLDDSLGGTIPAHPMKLRQASLPTPPVAWSPLSPRADPLRRAPGRRGAHPTVVEPQERPGCACSPPSPGTSACARRQHGACRSRRRNTSTVRLSQFRECLVDHHAQHPVIAAHFARRCPMNTHVDRRNPLQYFVGGRRASSDGEKPVRTGWNRRPTRGRLSNRRRARVVRCRPSGAARLIGAPTSPGSGPPAGAANRATSEAEHRARARTLRPTDRRPARGIAQDPTRSDRSGESPCAQHDHRDIAQQHHQVNACSGRPIFCSPNR